MEKASKFTKDTLIPVGVFFALVSCVVSIVWIFSSIATKVEAMEEKDCPTRNEFNKMNDSITEIRSDVKLLLKQN